MNPYITILLLNFLLAFRLFAHDSTIVSFSIGNIYLFQGSLLDEVAIGQYTQISYLEHIVGDTIIGNNTYQIFTRSPHLPEYFSGWSPVDTSSVFYQRADSTRIYKYNVASSHEDTVINFSDTNGMYIPRTGTLVLKDSFLIFNHFYLSIEETGGLYAEQFSLVQYFVGGFHEGFINLKGARIDGVEYGDTTLLAVRSQFNEESKPSDYILYQNYPNPFNPSTQIKYYTPVRGRVRLTVYDLLGRQAAILKNEIVNNGEHVISFDGANLATGVYFCRLDVGNSYQIRKMLLLK